MVTGEKQPAPAHVSPEQTSKASKAVTYTADTNATDRANKAYEQFVVSSKSATSVPIVHRPPPPPPVVQRSPPTKMRKLASDSDSDEDESPWTKSQMDQALKEKRVTQWTVGVTTCDKNGTVQKRLVYHPKNDSEKIHTRPPSCFKMSWVEVKEKSTYRLSKWHSEGKRLQFPDHPDATFYHFRAELSHLYKCTTNFCFVVDGWKMSPEQEFTTALVVPFRKDMGRGTFNSPYEIFIEHEE